MHKVVAALSKFGRFKNSSGRRSRAYGLVGSTNAYAGNKGILQPRRLKTMVLPGWEKMNSSS